MVWSFINSRENKRGIAMFSEGLFIGLRVVQAYTEHTLNVHWQPMTHAILNNYDFTYDLLLVCEHYTYHMAFLN